MQRPPGPRGREVLGFVSGRSIGRTILFLEQTARRFGPISSFRFLNQHIFLIDDPALIQEVLVTQQHNFLRDTGATLLRELVGDGLLTSEEPRHRERRRLLQPAFHRGQVASYADTMVRESRRVSAAWRENAAIDIAIEMKRLTLSIVGSALFGADFSDSAVKIAGVLQRVIRRSTWLTSFVALLEPLAIAYRRRFPHGPSLLFRWERAELERIIAPVIDVHRRSNREDLVSLLLSARDEQDGGLSDEDVRNEVVTMVLAGHETTARALTWAWYLIAMHPEVEQQLHAELEAVLGDREPVMEDIPRLTYASMVFTEALRLYPPALAFGRRPKEAVTLGGYTIPRGTSVFVSPYITQRNELNFERPREFIPDRWKTISPPKFAYFPFGGGAKMCIGEPFARMEGVLVLATLARHWRLVVQDGAAARRLPEVVLRPDRPIVMRPIARVVRSAVAGLVS